MKNPHIIVGAQRRCVCGMYAHNSENGTSCMDVLQAIARLPDNPDTTMIRDVVAPLVVDCDDPERVDDMTPELRAAIKDIEGFKRYLATVS